MTKTYKFEKAGIDFSDGHLTINTLYAKLDNKHHDVVVTIVTSENLVKVTADQEMHVYNMRGDHSELPFDLFTDDSFEDHRKHFWSKPQRILRHTGWLTFKKRNPREYISNNYTLIK